MFTVQWSADRTRSRWFVHFVYIFSAGRCTFVVVAKFSSILLIIFVVALNKYFFTYSVTECVKRFRSLRAMVSHTKVSILPISPIGPIMLSSLCPILTFWRSQGYLQCGRSKWSRCGIIHVRVKVQVIVWYWWLGPTVFRGKFCQIPRRRLPNSADHRGKFLEFRGSPRPPMSIAWTTAEIWPFFDFGGRPPSWVLKVWNFNYTGPLSKANTRPMPNFE